MADTTHHEDFGLFPPLPEELTGAEAAQREHPDADFYRLFLESQCGATDDSQPVEQYDGTLGVSEAFVDEHQAPVGQLQWNDNLGAIYNSPGNVSGVRWCTGALISENLFLSAGHCFDQTGGGWQRPLVNGTNDIIPVTEIATNMHVNFNFQDDPDGIPRNEVEFAVEALLEYRLGGLDFAVLRLAGRPGRQFGIGRVAFEDAEVGDMLAIIGHPAGVPKRIEAGPLTSFDGDRIRYNDIDTLGGNSGSAIWHSPSGTIVGVHTNGGCTTGGAGSNSGVRISRILEESPIVSSVQMATLPTPLQGRHTMQQASNGRFVDAHEHSGEDFRLVTRTQQNNDTQRWVFLPDPDRLDTYTIQQLSNGRFVDAHVTSSEDFRVVTRTRQNNDTQRWVVTDVGNGSFRLQQRSTRRFVDAHEHSGEDFRLVTRTRQENDTQLWLITQIGRVYTIQQISSGRFVDAHEHSGEDFRLVTRTAQFNDTQLWVVLHQGNGKYTIQQLSNGRYVDAHEHSGEDFRLVTRTRQENDTQRWLITEV